MPLRHVLLAMLVLAGSLPAGAARAQDASALPFDTGAIRSVWQSLDSTWNARDVAGFTALFTEDASLWFVGVAGPFDGRASIHRRYAAQFPRYAPGTRHHTRVERLRAVAPGVVMIDGVADITAPDPEHPRVTRVLRHYDGVAVMVRVGDQWRIHTMRAFLARPPK